MSSSHVRLAVPAAVVTIVATLWWHRSALGQAPAADNPAWEYATVEGFYEGSGSRGQVRFYGANVCYHGTSGCRWDTIRVSVTQWGQINDAVAAATARLGERGWEAVSVTPLRESFGPEVLLKRRRPAGE
jgi:hypothetical protein